MARYLLYTPRHTALQPSRRFLQAGSMTSIHQREAVLCELNCLSNYVELTANLERKEWGFRVTALANRFLHGFLDCGANTAKFTVNIEEKSGVWCSIIWQSKETKQKMSKWRIKVRGYSIAEIRVQSYFYFWNHTNAAAQFYRQIYEKENLNFRLC